LSFVERVRPRACAIALAAGLALAPMGMTVTAASPAAAAGVQLVYGLGDNYYGQAGNRLASTSAGSPLPVTGLAQDVAQVAAGGYISVALHTDGTVWTWGSNFAGALGDGSGVQKRTVPGRVPGLPRIVQVAAGGAHVLAVGEDGSLWAWGANGSDQLGDGRDRSSEMSAATPVRVLLSGVAKVAAGSIFSVAVRTNGEVWTWGSNDQGQLGNQTSVAMSPTPVRALTPDGITEVAAGYAHALAIAGDGSVWAWGQNASGELGIGTLVSRNAPVRVEGLFGVTRISAGMEHSMAIGAGGVVWTWGENQSGQVGDGTVTDRLRPTGLPLGAPSTRIAAGNQFDLAVLSDGTLWGWGSLPVTESNRPPGRTPRQVASASGVVQVVAAQFSVLLLMEARPVAVPNLQYLQDDAAGDSSAFQLDGVGLTLGAVSLTDVDCQFSGMIMGQDPAAGTVVPALTAVSVVLVDPNVCF
jgi:alpha-tubulin suppressor-like RCC1 family protein